MKRMMFSFPDWLNEFVPADDVFATAYEDIADSNRAWLKTNIARLLDIYGARQDVGGTVDRRFRSGFNLKATHEAVDFAVILFDSSLLSPARLLAALIPAFASGVEHVLAARVGANGGPWRKAVLTGLELAGQELVVDLTDAQARRLFTHLRDTNRPGAVSVLGPKAASIKSTELQAASRMGFWRPRFTRAAAIWMDDEQTFDLNVLAFMHPDMVFSVFGAQTELPADNFSYEGEDLADFMDAIIDVAYTPQQHMSQAMTAAKLVLGPGQEGCWIWPDLYPEHYQYHTIAWTNGASSE